MQPLFGENKSSAGIKEEQGVFKLAIQTQTGTLSKN